MSSSISADYSPTSNYSYPTDLSLSPTSPTRQFPPLHDQRPPPRLSSPHIFRDIFANEGTGSSARPPLRLPPLQEINFAETMQDVNRALQSANRAIQTAQEAFQSRRTSSTNLDRGQDVVDLTNSPPTPSRSHRLYDSFLSHTIHPHDSRTTNRMPNRAINEPIYPVGLTPNVNSLFVDDDDPTSAYAGQSDSGAAARRRFAAQQVNHRRSQMMNIPPIGRTLVRGISMMQRQEEEEAIRRQRIAREQWEQVQQRQQQRDRLQQQRDRILGRTPGNRNQSRPSSRQAQPHWNQQDPALSPSDTIHEPGSTLLHRTSTSSLSSVEAVDLTSVDNQTDLAAALLHSQAANPTANPVSSSAQARSALTAYKCPICLEPPRNATSTICGHLFCHECILETLKNSENMRREDAPPHRKVKGQCPVCRKELARREDEGSQRTLVPLEIQLVSKKKLEELRQQEQKKRQRATEKQNKGKGKEKENASTDPDKEIFELSSEDENDWKPSGSSQKENKAKRLKLSASEELDEELFSAFTNDEQLF